MVMSASLESVNEDGKRKKRKWTRKWNTGRIMRIIAIITTGTVIPVKAETAMHVIKA